jgi:hypothetical protein
VTGEILTGDLRTASAAVQRQVADKAREVIQARWEDATLDAQDGRSLAGQQVRTTGGLPSKLVLSNSSCRPPSTPHTGL